MCVYIQMPTACEGYVPLSFPKQSDRKQTNCHLYLPFVYHYVIPTGSMHALASYVASSYVFSFLVAMRCFLVSLSPALCCSSLPSVRVLRQLNSWRQLHLQTLHRLFSVCIHRLYIYYSYAHSRPTWSQMYVTVQLFAQQLGYFPSVNQFQEYQLFRFRSSDWLAVKTF